MTTDHTPKTWETFGTPRLDLARLISAVVDNADQLYECYPDIRVPDTGLDGYLWSPPFTIKVMFDVWQELPEYFIAECPACGGRARGLHAGGLLTVGGINGICCDCGTRVLTRVGGVANVRWLFPEELFKRIRAPQRDLDPGQPLVTGVMLTFTEEEGKRETIEEYRRREAQPLLAALAELGVVVEYPVAVAS